MLIGDGRQSGSVKFAIDPDIIGAREQMFGAHHAFSPQTLKPQGLFNLGAEAEATNGTKTAAIVGALVSVAAIAGGVVIDVNSYKPAPMPASLRPVFKTGVQWQEPSIPLFILATVLEVGGFVGLITSIRMLMR